MTISLIGNFDRSPGSDNRRLGFTLLELIVVVLILGILVSLSAPSLGSSARRFAFSQSVNRVMALWRYIQRHAVAEQQSYRVVIESAGKSKRVERLSADQTGEHWERWSSSLVTDTLAAPTFSWRNVQENVVVFYPNGAISGSEVVLSDNFGNRAAIATTLSGEIFRHHVP